MSGRFGRIAQRGLALALSAGVVWLAYAAAVAPLAARFAAVAEETAEARRMLARYEAVASRRAELEAELARLRAAAAATELYLAGGADALAAASLQDMVSDAVQRGGGEAKTIEVLTPEDQDGFRRIAVRVQFEAPIAAIAAVLHDLEGRRPYLLLDNVEIRATGLRPGQTPEREPRLNVRFDVAGYAAPALSEPALSEIAAP